jgi:hypothetical protein
MTRSRLTAGPNDDPADRGLGAGRVMARRDPNRVRPPLFVGTSGTATDPKPAPEAWEFYLVDYGMVGVTVTDGEDTTTVRATLIIDSPTPEPHTIRVGLVASFVAGMDMPALRFTPGGAAALFDAPRAAQELRRRLLIAIASGR